MRRLRKSREEAIQYEEHRGCDTYVFDRNRNYNRVPAGTRASATVLVYPHVTDHLRVRYAQRAIRKAAIAWESRWGAVPWASTQIVVTHVSFQVCVEFRVEP